MSLPPEFLIRAGTDPQFDVEWTLIGIIAGKVERRDPRTGCAGGGREGEGRAPTHRDGGGPEVAHREFTVVPAILGKHQIVETPRAGVSNRDGDWTGSTANLEIAEGDDGAASG
jgi:hypothetical protein